MPKPSAANAAIDVRIVEIFFSRANAASIDGCIGFSSSMTSPRTSSFSYWPRGGSCMKNAAIATIAAGDAEHEERPAPALRCRRPSVAIAPTSTGLRLPSTCWPRFIAADIRARMPIG